MNTSVTHDQNLAYFYGAGMILVLLGIGLICYVIISIAYKRKEQARQQPRYVLNEQGQIIGREEPLPPHHYCNWYMCIDQQAKTPCTFGHKQ